MRILFSRRHHAPNTRTSRCRGRDRKTRTTQKSAKALRHKWETEGPDNRLFDACFRIQREANIATGYICEACGAPDEPRVVMVRPAGYGHADDLPEYDPCPECLFKSKRYIPLIVRKRARRSSAVGRSQRRGITARFTCGATCRR